MYELSLVANVTDRAGDRADPDRPPAAGSSRAGRRGAGAGAVGTGRCRTGVGGDQLGDFQDTAILFLSTACVIVPGLAFVILVERGGAPQAIGAWVKELGWTPPAQVIFIVLGLAPLLEAMTGFGVSLIATVPLLMGLFTRQSGMKIALAGMVIMPWGTLGLATVIGALLAHLPAETLGSHSALISAPVFLCLAAIAMWQGGIRSVSPWIGLVVVTALFVAVLFSINLWIGPEVSGVLAGLAVACVGLGISYAQRKNWCAGRMRRGLTSLCWG